MKPEEVAGAAGADAVTSSAMVFAKGDVRRVRGLMAIPPICHISGENRKFFQKMCKLSVDITTKKYDNVRVDILSMGMSDDFRDAIACGSTMIRIGTAIFGKRNYQ